MNDGLKDNETIAIISDGPACLSLSKAEKWPYLPSQQTGQQEIR